MQEPDALEQPTQHAIVAGPTTDSEEHFTNQGEAIHLKDHVDCVIEGWKRVRPDLNVAPIGIISRLERLHIYLHTEINMLFERFGLTNPSFAVIATLRRAGKPYQCSQRALMDALQLTSGTISVRIDRLERDGLVERLPDPNDQRGVLVRLTAAGEQLFDQVAPLHLANEERLLSALQPEQREQLAELLRILLLSFDTITATNPYHPSRWIGASLAPAHIARKTRYTSGLPDIVGLLVQNVTPLSPASVAGLQEGDLIVVANEAEIRSIEDLYKQLLATRGKVLKLEVLHGIERKSLLLNVNEPFDAT